MRRLATLLLAIALPLGLVGGASAEVAIEDYADYDPQTNCHPAAREGTLRLAAWLERRFDDTHASTKGRRCRVGGTSEHKEGRAIDWVLDATKRRDRLKAKAFLAALRAADGEGNEDALARRMGVMYVIWNDHMFPAYDRFQRRDYLSSSCKTVRKCSPTLRHRDHLHISLSRPGGKGLTSWYVMQAGGTSPRR